MKRRDFFKDTGILACGCALGSVCSNALNKKENKNTQKIDNEDIIKAVEKKKYFGWIKHVEFLIAYHCNLNCAYCNNMSPIAPKSFLPVDVFEKDIIQMSKITNGKIREIGLFGGEPLLNKDIEKYIEIARNNFQESKITIATNGLLLNEMSDSFWNTCAKNNANIKFTHYPLHKSYPILLEAHKKAKKYGVELTLKSSIYYFRSLNLNKNQLNDKISMHKNCADKNCIIVDNSTLYPCPCIQTVNMFFNKHFKENKIPVDKNDTQNIYKLSSIDEIFKLINTPKDMCKYCNYINQNYKDKLWTYSKKELCEWYDVAKA